MSVLEQIFKDKREEVEKAKRNTPLEELVSVSKDAEAPRGFRAALAKPNRDLALIAEVKKASPSEGLIREDFDAGRIAQTYERAGADALSVLTDSKYFQGGADNLRAAKEATKLPCLRKDFIYDPYQVYEARAWGADAVLLIVASLELSQIVELSGLIEELGMDALVEVHSEKEVELALAAKAKLIGVNNRDLSTFVTDLAMSERLLPIVSPHAATVSESALKTRADLDRVKAAGANAVLIGTTFCKALDIETKVREVMGS